MGAPFDPSQLLPAPGAFFRSDRGLVAFNAASLVGGQAHDLYFQTANSAFLNGLTKCTWAGFVSVPAGGGGTGENHAYCSQWNAAQDQCCFSIDRLASTFANVLKVRVASGLTDAGANYATGSTPIRPATGFQQTFHLCVAFDGTQATNAGRLAVYVSGVPEALTFTGTIPAALTASGAPLALGYNLHDGGNPSALLHNWGVCAGHAATQAEAAALAAACASRNPGHYGYASLPAGAPAFTHFWQLSEPSDGSGAVTRADSAGGAGLAEQSNPAGGAFVPSMPLLTYADSFGNGNQAQTLSLTPAQVGGTAVSVPTVSAAQTPSGQGAVAFAANNSVGQLDVGTLGLAAVPDGFSWWLALEMDDVSHANEGTAAGHDHNGGGTGPWAGSTSPDAVALNFEDFATFPGSANTTCGDGTHSNSAYTGANALAAGAWHVLEMTYVPGEPHCRLYVDDAQQALSDAAQTQQQIAPFSDLTRSGGAMTRLGLGGYGEWLAAFFNGNYRGKQAAAAFLYAPRAEDDRRRMRCWLMLWAGLPPPAIAAPAGLAAAPAPGQVTLTWGGVTGATSYDVLRGAAPGGETLLTNVAGTSCADAAVTPGVVYYYKARALVETTAGTAAGALSSEASATPPAPTGLPLAWSADPSRTMLWGQDVARTNDYGFNRGESLQWLCTPATPTSIAGWTLALYARKRRFDPSRSDNPPVLLTLTTTPTANGSVLAPADASAGTFTVTLKAADNLALGAGQVFYDVWRVDAGFEAMLAEGTWQINKAAKG